MRNITPFIALNLESAIYGSLVDYIEILDKAINDMRT